LTASPLRPGSLELPGFSLLEPQLRGGELYKYQEGKGGEEVKFICFWEFKPEDFDKLLEKRKQIFAEREKEPERFAKIIFGGYAFVGETKGFTVYETDDVEKLLNDVLFMSPEVTYKFVPIVETSKVVELRLKTKKA